jgi:hypothetical protein
LTEISLPGIVVQPIEERLSFTPSAARHQLFEAMPDIKDFRSHFTGFQLLKYDETVMLLFITDFLGKAVYRLYCDKSVAQLRPIFITPLRTSFASARYNPFIATFLCIPKIEDSKCVIVAMLSLCYVRFNGLI